MNGLLIIGMLLLQSLAASAEPTIFVHAQSDLKVLPQKVFESVLWHELQNSLGHDAKFVDQINLSVFDEMRRAQVTTLLEMSIEWRVDVVKLKGDRFTGGFFPTLTAREWAIRDGKLVALSKWTTTGTVALYRVKSGPENELISIPEISLQNATELALQPIEAPRWRREEPKIRVPVTVVADEEYRRFYGEQWKEVARQRIRRANALLGPAGVKLDIEVMKSWRSSARATSLSLLLDQLSAQPRTHDKHLRIGFTQQTTLAVKFHRDVEDVGRAYLPGRDLIIADQAAIPGHPNSWDVAEEGIAIAHEVLHAFGVPHEEGPYQLMSATKQGAVHQMSLKSIALARTAAQARYSHWDPNITLDSLSVTAKTHLSDPDLQIDYVAENFAHGRGDRQIERLEPKRLSALSNLAVGHYYLRQALKNPTASNALTSRALVHTDSALERNPTWVSANALKEAILQLKNQKETRVEIKQTKSPSVELECEPRATENGTVRPTCD